MTPAGEMYSSAGPLDGDPEAADPRCYDPTLREEAMTPDEVRDRIAAALMHHSWCWIDRGTCTCARNRHEDADAVLSVVREVVADELDATADGPRDCCVYCARLRARADRWRQP